MFISELKKTYNVRQISTSAKKIDHDIDLLMIIHPKNLSQELQYAIDQFVLSGKNAIIFVDPFCISDRSQNRRNFFQPSRSNLDKLFKGWGVKMDSSKAVADMDQSTALRTRDNRVIRNPLWITARHDTFSQDDVVTSKLERILFPVVGAIEKDLQSQYVFEPLVRTSKNAALFDAFKANFGVETIRKEFSPAPDAFALAVRVTGKFKTAFPSGPPSSKKEKKGKGKGTKKQEPEAQKKVADKKCSVIIVADADLLADRFYVQKQNVLGLVFTKMFNDNLNFVSNACEILTGSDALVEIRSRGRYERPFTKVIELRRKAQSRWLAKEQELARQADATNKKLRELEQQKDPSQKVLISPEQEKEIAKFREKRRRINKELREVRKNLRADIESLGTTLKAINIFTMPVCVSIVGLVFAFYRKRRIGRK
ncbi:MAG: Gldg family protein [Deltaproteobacteria bacterium]|nr:Gldg family protein [Deltaproteobacteria bacterium]